MCSLAYDESSEIVICESDSHKTIFKKNVVCSHLAIFNAGFGRKQRGLSDFPKNLGGQRLFSSKKRGRLFSDDFFPKPGRYLVNF